MRYRFDLTEGTRIARQFAKEGTLTTGTVLVDVPLPMATLEEQSSMRLTLLQGETRWSIGVGAARFIGEALRNEALVRATRTSRAGERAEVRELAPDRHLVVGWNHLGRREVAAYVGFEEQPVYLSLTAYTSDDDLTAVVEWMERHVPGLTVQWSADG